MAVSWPDRVRGKNVRRTLRISCEPVPPSVLPRGHEAALQSVRTGAAERFVCFIRLFDSLVTLLQSRRSRHGEATRPCPFRSAVFVRCRFPLRSPLQRRKARANPAFVPRIAQPLRYVGRVATALGPLATMLRSCLLARGPLPRSVRFVRQQIVSANPVRPRSDRSQLFLVNTGPRRSRVHALLVCRTLSLRTG